MNTLVLTGCTVEFAMPAMLGVDTSNGYIKILPAEHTIDLVVRCTEGELKGKTITFKKVWLKINAEMLPVMEGNNVVLFTVGDENKKPTDNTVGG